MIGTPSYMSPEQAEGKVDELGPATDVYALGAILYHMLTGRPPFTGDGRELMDRVIHGEFLPPRSLNPNVPLTLQAVCQTAMARTPGARYPSARALADDVSRWMSDEPVSVLRDPLLTRATRWARKHRVATAAVAAGLVVGLVAALAGLQRERTHAADLDRQRRRAEAGEKDAIAAVKRFSDVIRDEPALKDSAELKDLRAKLMKEPLSFFRSLRDRLQAERDTRPESLDALAEVSLDLGLLHYELGAGQDAMDAFQGGLVVSSELAKAYPLVARYEHHRVRLLHDHANVLRVNGRLPEARRELEDVLAALRRLSSSHPEVSLYQQDLVTAPMNLALVLHDLGETAEARRVLEESAAETRKLILKDPENIDLRIALMRYTANLGVILKDLNDLSEAERADREAIELGRSILARRPGDEFHQNDLTSPQTNLGTVLERLGRYEEARALFEEALAVQRSLAERHPAVSAYAVATARTQNGLGSVLRKQDRFEEARAAFEVSRDRFQKLFDEDPQSPEHQFDLGVSRVNLAELLLAMKRPDEARKELEAALPILRRLNTARPDVLQYQRGLTLCLRLLGGMARDSGQFDPALAIFREEREILRKIAGASQGRFDDQAELAATGSNIANVLQTAGRSAEARAEFEELLSVGRRLVKERPNADNLVSMLGITISNMAVGDLAAGRVDRAADGFREAVTLQRKALDARPANILYRAALSNHLDNLSRAAQRLGRDDEASAARREMEELDANNPQYAAVDARLNAVAGGAPAVSLAESLTLGRRAFSRKLYGLATKLWDAALRSDPMLGLDRKLQLRYDASCAAALAAAGKGKEFPPPDAASKVRFRGQALGWLRAELDLWKKQLEAPNPAVREAVLRILRHWREDTDLSGVRDADALAKLPEDERKAWQALWADVEGLISAETAKKRP
ncbi:MAG: tetratricopeptide repeat-containing protein kinase family protein [Isosphaeraceae bacterium]